MKNKTILQSLSVFRGKSVSFVRLGGQLSAKKREVKKQTMVSPCPLPFIHLQRLEHAILLRM